MNNKKTLLSIFILVALVQLYIPAQMIWEREDILTTGKEYKFKTAPVDPNDPFRGKYIFLNYKENVFYVKNEMDWQTNQKIYILLTEAKNGYAKIKDVLKEKPTESKDFVTAKINYITRDGRNKLTVKYPFDRFYMDEFKAYEAEQTYIRTEADTSKVTYALLRIKNGEAVLKDVLINNVSIRKIVELKQNGNIK